MARSKIIEGLKAAVRHARGDKTQATSYTVMVPADDGLLHDRPAPTSGKIIPGKSRRIKRK